MDALTLSKIRRRLGISQLRVSQGARLPLYKIQRFEQGILGLDERELRAVKKALKRAARDLAREMNCVSDRLQAGARSTT